MAKRKDTETAGKILPPKGFVRVSSTDCRIWARPVAGSIIAGKCVGRYKKKGEQKGEGSPYYYQVELEEQTPVMQYGDNNETEERMGEVGETINVQEWAGLTSLANVVFPARIWISCVGEKNLPNKRTMKVFEAYTAGTITQEKGGGDPIPF